MGFLKGIFMMSYPYSIFLSPDFRDTIFGGIHISHHWDIRITAPDWPSTKKETMAKKFPCVHLFHTTQWFSGTKGVTRVSIANHIDKQIMYQSLILCVWNIIHTNNTMATRGRGRGGRGWSSWLSSKLILIYSWRTDLPKISKLTSSWGLGSYCVDGNSIGLPPRGSVAIIVK